MLKRQVQGVGPQKAKLITGTCHVCELRDKVLRIHCTLPPLEFYFYICSSCAGRVLQTFNPEGDMELKIRRFNVKTTG